MRGFVFKRNGNEGADWVNLTEVQKVIDKLKTINTQLRQKQGANWLI